MAGFRWRGRLGLGLDEGVWDFRRRVAIWGVGALVGELAGEGADVVRSSVNGLGLEWSGVDTAEIDRAVVSGSGADAVGPDAPEVDGAGVRESGACG